MKAMEMKLLAVGFLMTLLSSVVASRAKTFGNTEQELERNEVCTEWIDPFWEFLTLNEERDAELSDFQRMFNLMDSDGNGEVSSADFADLWTQVTMMTQADSEAVFDLWAHLDDTVYTCLFIEDMDLVFEYYDTDGDSFVSKTEYADVWEEDLHVLPDKGCPGLA